MTAKLSGIRAASTLAQAAGRRMARWILRLDARDGAALGATETSYEMSLRTAFAARGWTFLLCAGCGHVADWVTGGSHPCSRVSHAHAEETEPQESFSDAGDDDCGALFDEIEQYLSSRDGRYDALVAALIIRAR